MIGSVPAPPLAVLSRPAAISLEELNEQAALQTRVDRKYVLAVGAAEAALTEIVPHARALEIDGARDFGYSSEYLDTEDLTSFLLSARGRRRRFKVRRRTYLESGEQYVEVKTRGSRGTTVKERIAEAGTTSGPLSPTSRAFVDDVLTRAGITSTPASRLLPTLRTSYRRSTLCLTEHAARVTVDTSLAWALPGQPAVDVHGIVIVETKSGSSASIADRLLWSHGHRPSRISKYGTGLSCLVPHLPSSKWHAVARRHLQDVPELQLAQRRVPTAQAA